MKKIIALVLVLTLVLGCFAAAEEEKSEYIEGINWYGCWQVNAQTGGQTAMFILYIGKDGTCGMTVVQTGKGAAAYYSGYLIGDTASVFPYVVELRGIKQVMGQLVLEAEMKSYAGDSFGINDFYFMTPAQVI